MNCGKIDFFFLVFTIFFSIYSFKSFSQNQNTLNAKIIAEVKDNLINLTALVENNDELYKDELSYLFVSLKKSVAGNYSKNDQSGKFSISPNELKKLSTLKINAERSDEVRVYLFIRKNDILYSKDSLVINAKQKLNEQKKIIKETDFSIKGIVIDNALTKIGKDFNDFFYQAYSFSNSRYAFVITVKERPYFGRNSIISVEVNQDKIIEFFAKPDEDYLKSYVSLALKELRAYNTKQQLLFGNKKI